jgi:prepilin-type processing-associated H-X9-DG protein
LGLAWHLYAGDNDGKLASNSGEAVGETFPPGLSVIAHNWVIGFMFWSTDRKETTNHYYLSSPQYSLLAPHLNGQHKVYKCPEDGFLAPEQKRRGWTARARSVSMNYWVGDGGQDEEHKSRLALNYKIFVRDDDFVGIGPSQLWVFIDQHPDSVRRPTFFITPWAETMFARWIEVPASYHQGGATLSFADGHAELRKWKSPAMRQPVRYQTIDLGSGARTTSEDYRWVADRSTLMIE